MPIKHALRLFPHEFEEAIKRGACAYVRKDSGEEELIAAVRAAAAGRKYLSTRVDPAAVDVYIEKSHSGPLKPHDLLTTRELEVLQLLTKGHSTKAIADKLHIAFNTVRSHLKNIYVKLHVNCGKEAIAKVLAEHITL